MVERDPAPAPRLVGLFEIAGVWCLAIVQPLLDLVGQNAPFLLHHRADGLDLAIWIAALALGPPAVLWSASRLVDRVVDQGVGERLHAGVLAALIVLFALGVLRRLGDPVPAWLLLPLAVSALWLSSTTIASSSSWRRFFAYLSLALPVVVAIFWASPAAVAARATAARRAGPLFVEEAAARETARVDAALAPVVMVVFDELPLTSLLDAEHGIDAQLAPNLAELTRTATWFRNASTVWSSTNQSIVSMLTGRLADRTDPPTRLDYPDNMLTWLDSSHRVRAFELLTSMAPPSAIDLQPAAPRGRRLLGLASDASIVAAHQLTPPDLGRWLPPIDSRWGDFRDARVVRGRADPEAEPIEPAPWAFALADGRWREFDSFLRSIDGGSPPGLYFAHVMLPHMPYRYLPSGRVYGGRPVYEQGAEAWLENDWFALETYQRHLLQVGFVDHLVGELVATLRESGLWDRAVLVITSDHGASHWPGQDRRLPEATEHPDDILRVPLFIRLPGQSEGAIDDRTALTLDILPTVAEALGLEVPWPLEGASLLGEPRGESERRLNDPAGGSLVFTSSFRPDQESLNRKLELFDPAFGELRWVGLGRYRELIGRSGEELDIRVSGPAFGCMAEVDQVPALEDWDPAARFSPALLTGSLECRDLLPPDPWLITVLNGRASGSAALQRVEDRAALFSVMNAEAALRSGSNDLGLYLASGAPANVYLARVQLTDVEPGRD